MRINPIGKISKQMSSDIESSKNYNYLNKNCLFNILAKIFLKFQKFNLF